MTTKFLKQFKLPKTLSGAQIVVILVLTLSMLFHNVTGLAVGRDEGVHAFAAKTLAFEGRYALKDGPAYIDFDRRIAVGPTIIVPTAWVYKIFGFSVATTRVVPAIYFLLFILFFHLLVKKAFGDKPAFLASLFVLSSQWPFWRDLALFNPIYRTLTGESAALFFLVCGFYIWDVSFKKKFILGKILGLLIIGLSVLTKYQFALVLLPLFMIGSVPERDGPSRFRISFLSLVSLVPLVLWFLYQYLCLGSAKFFGEINTYGAFGDQTFSFSLFRAKQNIIDKWAELNPNSLRIFFTLPSIIFGWVYLKHKRILGDPLKLFLVLFPTIWMVWYVFSRGYIRYEIPGLYFSLIFLALFFIQIGRVPFRDSPDLKAFLFSMLFLIVSFGFYIGYRESKVVEENHAQEMAVFIEKALDKEEKVLTSELDYEVDLFLDDRVVYHAPAGTREKAENGRIYLFPKDVDYILTKKNDATFSTFVESGLAKFVYNSGDWYLYANLARNLVAK